MQTERGLSAVIGTLIIVVITVLIAVIISAQIVGSFGNVLDNEGQTLAGVTFSETEDGSIEVEVVSVQRGTQVYVQAVNGTVEETRDVNGQNQIAGPDTMTDVTDSCIVRDVNETTRITVVASNGETEQVIATHDPR